MNPELQKRLDFLRSIGFNISQQNIDSLTKRSEAGEDIEKMWADVLKYIVGSQRRVAADWIQSIFGDEKISGERMGRLVDELVSGKRTFDQMRKDILKATGQAENTQGADEDDPNDIKIMGGPHQWYRSSTGDWYIAYKAPGNQWVYFEVTEDEMDAIFGKGVRPEFRSIKSEGDLAKDPKFHFGGGVAEVTGDGNFLNEANKAIERALADGVLPDWLDVSASEEILGYIYIAQTQGKGTDWLINQIAGTKAFQQRYNGIDVFRAQGMSWVDSVNAYRQYESALNTMHKRRGDNITVSPDLVAKYLRAGHSVDDVKFVYDSFDQLEANTDAFKAFNEILRARGMKPMTKLDQVKFIQGNAPQELYQIWEEFAVLHEARQAGIGNYLTAQEAVELAQATAGIQTQEKIAEGMRDAAALALRYRSQIDVTKYGLTADDIIDMSMGLAPRSGKSQADLVQIMQRISSEAEGFLRQKVAPYTGFTPEGRPQTASLAGVRQQQ